MRRGLSSGLPVRRAWRAFPRPVPRREWRDGAGPPVRCRSMMISECRFRQVRPSSTPMTHPTCRVARAILLRDRRHRVGPAISRDREAIWRAVRPSLEDRGTVAIARSSRCPGQSAWMGPGSARLPIQEKLPGQPSRCLALHALSTLIPGAWMRADPTLGKLLPFRVAMPRRRR